MKSFFKFLFASFIGALLALGVFCIVTVIYFAAMIAISASSSSKENTLPDSFVLKIDLASPVGERSVDDPLSDLYGNLGSLKLSMGGNALGIKEAVEAINAASEDPAVKLIYLKANDASCSMPNMEALRRALETFRLSGKPVIAYADNYSQASYFIASVADRIYVNNQCFLPMTGLGTSMMFFKDLLDKLGLNVECIRHGKFKAAAEQFIENHISEANKLQNERMLASIWESWSEDICRSREISREKLDSLVNALAISDAVSMIENNLADSSVTKLEIGQVVANLFGVEKEKDVKMVNLADYAGQKSANKSKSKDKLAVIYAEGEIVMEGEGMAAQTLCPVIRKVATDSTVKAVVLRVNSPGGDAQAAEQIRVELQELRKSKPLVCSFGEYAASGGYWISAQSDEIITERTTITGSIGVFSLLFNYGNALKKTLDINTENFGTHKHSTFMAMSEPLDNVERAYMQNMVEDVYTRFISIVADGRNMSLGAVDSLGQGRVWTGSDAVACSLADKIGGLDLAIEEAAQIAGLMEYKVQEYPKVKSSIETFMESLSNGGKAAVCALIPSLQHKYILPEQFRCIENAYSSLNRFDGSKAYARIPYIYEITY